MAKKQPTPYVYRVHLSFVHSVELFTVFEFDLGYFERISEAEHIRRMIAACTPQFKVLLTCREVKNPRLTYDLSHPVDYRVF